MIDITELGIPFIRISQDGIIRNYSYHILKLFKYSHGELNNKSINLIIDNQNVSKILELLKKKTLNVKDELFNYYNDIIWIDKDNNIISLYYISKLVNDNIDIYFINFSKELDKQVNKYITNSNQLNI